VTPLARVERVLQRIAGRAVAALPLPPEVALLSQARARLAGEIRERRAVEVAAVRDRWQETRERAGSAGSGRTATAFEAARADLVRLGDSLVDELRAGVAALPDEAGLLARLVGRADGMTVSRAPEHLDSAELDEARRTEEIRVIDRMNRGFGSYARFAHALEPLLDGAPAVTILDVASGHGGFPLALAELAPGRGRRLRIIASDLRPEYLAVGERRARRDGLDVEFRVADALRLDETFGDHEIDVVTCTQSLHHFGPGWTAAFLAEAVRTARRGVLFIDLLRTPLTAVGAAALGLFAPSLVAPLGTRRMILEDSVLSFRKGFVAEELALLAACVPGGERIESMVLAPAFAALRTAT
jgi:ubiquinone/menaquinone biosynthesis C-methylase UbiE